MSTYFLSPKQRQLDKAAFDLAHAGAAPCADPHTDAGQQVKPVYKLSGFKSFTTNVPRGLAAPKSLESSLSKPRGALAAKD